MGGLVLGAEVALLLEAALKIRPLWAYGVGAGVGAVGGALTGFASDEAGNTELSMGFLVGAIVLAIPTTVAVLQATSYHAPSLNDGAERSRSGPLIALHVRPSPTSFLGEYHQDSLAIGVPDVKVSQVYSSTERATYRLPSATQVLVPVLQVSF